MQRPHSMARVIAGHTRSLLRGRGCAGRRSAGRQCCLSFRPSSLLAREHRRAAPACTHARGAAACVRACAAHACGRAACRQGVLSCVWQAAESMHSQLKTLAPHCTTQPYLMRSFSSICASGVFLCSPAAVFMSGNCSGREREESGGRNDCAACRSSSAAESQHMSIRSADASSARPLVSLPAR